MSAFPSFSSCISLFFFPYFLSSLYFFFLCFSFSSFSCLFLSLSIFYLYSFILFPSHLFFSILPTNIYWTLLCQAWGTQVRSFSLCTLALLVPPASASSRHGVPAVSWGARRAETRSRVGEEGQSIWPRKMVQHHHPRHEAETYSFYSRVSVLALLSSGVRRFNL